MRTRCPACGTVFRVTSAQLRLKAGKVRCGSCQSVFNAFDQWLPDAESFPGAELPPETVMASADDWRPEIRQHPQPADIQVAPEESVVEPAPASPAKPLDDEPALPPADRVEALVAQAESPARAEHDSLGESPEESTQAARQAGLVAARELSDSPAFNRWAAGTLAADAAGQFAGDSNQRALWPFALVAALLFMGLLAQMLYYFRTEIALRLPDAAALYEAAAIDVPLPRNAALVSIEASDLQSDNARGLFVLQATLKNRAAYAQAWPALELSLTDTSDTVVSRRVMFAADYLPPGTKSNAFPANGDVAVKLWIEAKQIGAAGYRLYIFYP